MPAPQYTALVKQSLCSVKAITVRLVAKHCPVDIESIGWAKGGLGKLQTPTRDAIISGIHRLGT